MRYPKLMYLIILGLIIAIAGCASNKSVVEFVREGGLETKGLTNLALASNGTKITVSQGNPDHPASTLNNGITSSEKWNEGEGWESEYQGRFSRGRYLGYGMEDPALAEDRGFDESFDTGDTEWRGLRMQTRGGRNINTALGWVVAEFPEPKMVNRAVIYTIDSEEFPAKDYGVRDMALQYWNKTVDTWAAVERVGKIKGQTTNAIHGNKSGVIAFRFKPVETPRMRLVVRWTNDSKERRRGYYMHANAKIRLIEIEVYGYEQDEVESESPVTAIPQDANKLAEIGVIIGNYVDGYNRRNIDILMASISQNYSRDGETYQKLRNRMRSILGQYERVELKLGNIKIDLTERGATATSTYSAHYEQTAHEPSAASGNLIFQLSDATGHWKITRIDSR